MRRSARTRAQDYPEYEILFGVRDPADPARRRYPPPAGRVSASAKSVSSLTTREAPNGKVAALAELAQQARYPILLVNDSDILVEPDYLRRVVAPLEDPRNRHRDVPLSRARGNLARPVGGHRGRNRVRAQRAGGALWSAWLDSRWDRPWYFAPRSLAQIGGFPAIESYIADDYQLGARDRATGLRVVLSTVVVETNLSGASWGEVWRHQLRWSRTIRVSRTAGYYGYLVTQASFWASDRRAGRTLGIALVTSWCVMAAGVMAGRCRARRHTDIPLLVPHSTARSLGFFDLDSRLNRVELWSGEDKSYGCPRGERSFPVRKRKRKNLRRQPRQRKGENKKSAKNVSNGPFRIDRRAL